MAHSEEKSRIRPLPLARNDHRPRRDHQFYKAYGLENIAASILQIDHTLAGLGCEAS